MAMAIAMMAIVLTNMSSLNIYECDDEEINLPSDGIIQFRPDLKLFRLVGRKNLVPEPDTKTVDETTTTTTTTGVFLILN